MRIRECKNFLLGFGGFFLFAIGFAQLCAQGRIFGDFFDRLFAVFLRKQGFIKRL